MSVSIRNANEIQFLHWVKKAYRLGQNQTLSILFQKDASKTKWHRKIENEKMDKDTPEKSQDGNSNNRQSKFKAKYKTFFLFYVDKKYNLKNENHQSSWIK